MRTCAGSGTWGRGAPLTRNRRRTLCRSVAEGPRVVSRGVGNTKTAIQPVNPAPPWPFLPPPAACPTLPGPSCRCIHVGLPWDLLAFASPGRGSRQRAPAGAAGKCNEWSVGYDCVFPYSGVTMQISGQPLLPVHLAEWRPCHTAPYMSPSPALRPGPAAALPSCLFRRSFTSVRAGPPTASPARTTASRTARATR